MDEDSLQLELKNKRICRFCMTQSEPLSNIYSRENRLKSSAPLPLQIMACVSIEVFTNDGMPSTICDNCRMLMEHCYKFKQMCKKADTVLRQYPLKGIWPQPMEIPKLHEDLIQKMYPNLVPKEKIIASTQTDLKFVIQQPQRAPRLLNKNSVKILNKEAQKNPEPILSQPRIKRDSDGNVEIITEILEQAQDCLIDPIKNAAPVKTNVFPCPNCERSFPLRQLLDIHMVNHTRQRCFQCEMCSKSFFSKYDLGKHVFIHTGEKPFECVVCKKAFTRSTLLHRHEKIHTDQPRFLCPYCEKPFLSNAELDKHTERHKKNRPFSCKICNKSFAFKQGLERHETVHAKEQPYPCQYCDNSFSTPSKLARHLTAHAGERPFPCKLCPKSYLLSHHLTRHLRSHKQGSGSYKCFDCEKVFTTRDDLIYHSAVHATQTLICPLCKEQFDDLDHVTEHIKNHAEGEQFACEFCDLIFMTAQELQAHSDKEHSEDLAAYQEHDKNISIKREMSQNYTDDSQESINNNGEVIEEFIIEEYHQGEEDGQMDETIIKKEPDIVLSKDIIITRQNKIDNKRKQRESIASVESATTFIESFEDYTDVLEIESLTKDQSEEYIIDDKIIDDPIPVKIMKLSSKENQKKSVEMSSLLQNEMMKIHSSQPGVQKFLESREQQQQEKQSNDTSNSGSLKLKQSQPTTPIKRVLKQLSKSVTVTKKKTSSGEISEEEKSPTLIAGEVTKSTSLKNPRVLNTVKIISTQKVYTNKSTTQNKLVNQNVDKTYSKSRDTNLSPSSSSKEYQKSTGVTSKPKESSKNISNTSSTKEKRSSDNSTKQTSSNKLQSNQSPVASTSSSAANEKAKDASLDKKFVEMYFGDRKVRVQKIMMTKSQLDLMAKEGKIEVKDGEMMLKRDANKNTQKTNKMVTRSTRQQTMAANK